MSLQRNVAQNPLDRWQVASVGRKRNLNGDHLKNPNSRWEDDIKTYLKLTCKFGTGLIWLRIGTIREFL
jgi:hypothetical protein